MSTLAKVLRFPRYGAPTVWREPAQPPDAWSRGKDGVVRRIRRVMLEFERVPISADLRRRLLALHVVETSKETR